MAVSDSKWRSIPFLKKLKKVKLLYQQEQTTDTQSQPLKISSNWVSRSRARQKKQKTPYPLKWTPYPLKWKTQVLAQKEKRKKNDNHAGMESNKRCNTYESVHTWRAESVSLLNCPKGVAPCSIRRLQICESWIQLLILGQFLFTLFCNQVL